MGAAAATRRGIAIDWTLYLLGQVSVLATQLMAQYLNEYYDREVDRLAAGNRTWFSGGSGILPAGGVSASAVLAAARICAGIAVLSGILASILSPWMGPIVILSFLGSWFYSSPPVSLMSSGWGELTTSVVVALLVPLAGYCMQGVFPPGEFWLVLLPLILIHAAMLISFEFPDRATDLSAGKRTLTVRLGFQTAAWVVTVLIGSAFLLLSTLALASNYPGRWMGLAFPLAIWQIVQIHRIISSPTRARYHWLTIGGIGLFVMMSLLALFGLFTS